MSEEPSVNQPLTLIVSINPKAWNHFVTVGRNDIPGVSVSIGNYPRSSCITITRTVLQHAEVSVDAIVMSPATARLLQLSDGDKVVINPPDYSK